MNTTQLPLLVKGYSSNQNGQNPTIPPFGTAISWNNVFDSGRGNVVGIDAIQTGNYQFFGRNTGALITISIAGIEIISNVNADDFAPIANPGNYFITPIKQPGGQTIQCLIGSSSGNNGLQVLAFYENKYATPEMKQKLIYARLKRKYQAFYYNVTVSSSILTSNTFTIPQSQGNVVGIEFVAYLNSTGNFTDLGLSTTSVIINGTTIIENLINAYGANHSTRPTIFPIFIAGGNTLSFNVNAGFCAINPNFTVGVKLYFDESND